MLEEITSDVNPSCAFHRLVTMWPDDLDHGVNSGGNPGREAFGHICHREIGAGVSAINPDIVRRRHLIYGDEEMQLVPRDTGAAHVHVGKLPHWKHEPRLALQPLLPKCNQVSRLIVQCSPQAHSWCPIAGRWVVLRIGKEVHCDVGPIGRGHVSAIAWLDADDLGIHGGGGWIWRQRR